jgi:hypothetical protein
MTESAWTVTVYPSREKPGSFTVIAVHSDGQRMIRREKYTQAMVDAFDPDAHWATR